MQLATAWIGAALLAGATILYYGGRAGGVLQRPATVMDHVSPEYHETRTALLLLPKMRRAIPRGATVAVFEPRGGHAPDGDVNFLVAVGLLPKHMVVPPFAVARATKLEYLPEYVIAVRKPFEHPHYERLVQLREGGLYKVRR